MPSPLMISRMYLSSDPLVSSVPQTRTTPVPRERATEALAGFATGSGVIVRAEPSITRTGTWRDQRVGVDGLDM